MHLWNIKAALTGTDTYYASDSRKPARAHNRNPDAHRSQVGNPPDELRVLIVDDNEDDRFLVSRALLKAGFSVDEAGSGQQALEAFQSRRPSIIILDLLMPCTGGLSACRLLRDEPGGRNLPILMFSGLSDDGTMRRAYDAGATDFMAKPTLADVAKGYETLVSRVRYLLNNRHTMVNYNFD